MKWRLVSVFSISWRMTSLVLIVHRKPSCFHINSQKKSWWYKMLQKHPHKTKLDLTFPTKFKFRRLHKITPPCSLQRLPLISFRFLCLFRFLRRCSACIICLSYTQCFTTQVSTQGKRMRAKSKFSSYFYLWQTYKNLQRTDVVFCTNIKSEIKINIVRNYQWFTGKCRSWNAFDFRRNRSLTNSALIQGAETWRTPQGGGVMGPDMAI